MTFHLARRVHRTGCLLVAVAAVSRSAIERSNADPACTALWLAGLGLVFLAAIN